MSRVWQYPQHDESLVRELANGLRVPAILAQIMTSREVRSLDEGRGFLEAKLTELHEPDLLPGISAAADRVTAAVRDGRKITIYGDYDVDGVTAVSILWHCLRLSGAKVDYYIPHRLDEGYGLNDDAIRKLASEDPGQLVITVDCGVASPGEARLAAELGLELIVTDHHQFAEELPWRRRRSAIRGSPSLTGLPTTRSESCAERESPSNWHGRSASVWETDARPLPACASS